MTAAAQHLQNRRQRFAAPGGTHDRLVHVLAAGLPMAIGVLAAFLVLVPLSPRGEVSFLLDRDKVAVAQDRVRVDNAMYRGADDRGRPFSVKAGAAVQRSAAVPRVEMDDLTARLLMAEGPARLDAAAGIYGIENERLAFAGPVRFRAADGYDMVARNVMVDLNDKIMVGRGGIAGAIPAGTFSADRIRADLAARTLTLDGHARMRMVPGKLSIPR